MAELEEIVDVSHVRARAVPVPAWSGCTAIENILGTGFVQVDSFGVATPLASGTSAWTTSDYVASNYGILPTNADNSTALSALNATIRASGRGGRVWFSGVDYKFTSGITDTTGGFGTPYLEYHGTSGTRFLADGASLLAAGTLLQPMRYFHCYQVTFGATAQRTGGQLIAVTGDMVVADAVPLMDIQFGNCNMTSGFNGLLLQDNGSGKGVCGFSWEGRSLPIGFCAGGVVFNLQTPNGTVITINNVSHKETAGASGASRPLATMRVQGAADLRCDNIESVYCQNGLIIDPTSSGRAATLFMQKMIMGQTTGAAISIAPNASADCHSLQFLGGYCDIGGMQVNANPKGIAVSGMTFLGNSSDAIQLNGTSRAYFDNILFSGSNAKCFHALNNAKNFRLTGGFANDDGTSATNNSVGVHIEAGCDKYQVATLGSEYCTTPLIQPTPGGSSSVSMF